MQSNVPPFQRQVTVDIATRLSEVGLAGLPNCCWPSPALVNKLATEAAALQRSKVAKPFVFVKLQEWLPDFAKLKGGTAKGVLSAMARMVFASANLLSGVAEEPEECNGLQELAKAIRGEDQPRQQTLTPFLWSMALDRRVLFCACNP